MVANVQPGGDLAGIVLAEPQACQWRTTPTTEKTFKFAARRPKTKPGLLATRSWGCIALWKLSLSWLFKRPVAFQCISGVKPEQKRSLSAGLEAKLSATIWGLTLRGLGYRAQGCFMSSSNLPDLTRLTQLQQRLELHPVGRCRSEEACEKHAS